MSRHTRKGDIEVARMIYMDTPGYQAIDHALEAAFDLGRAAQAERDYPCMTGRACERAYNTAKRLRAKVRKRGETR